MSDLVLCSESKPDYATFCKKIDVAVERIRLSAPSPYLAFSCGKDSVVIKRLADMASVNYDAHYNVCGGVDMPEAIACTRQHYPDVVFDAPQMSMRRVCLKEGIPPDHRRRFCCATFKEVHGNGRTILQGIRWAESTKRKDRRWIEQCTSGRDALFVNPIIDWSDADVWAFVTDQNIPVCSVYAEGWDRVGCVMCPQKSGADMRRDARRWPKVANYWLSIFRDVWQMRVDQGRSVKQSSPEEWFEWWQRDRGNDIDGQMEMEDL